MQNSYWQDLLPMALECGMTPTQFWFGEPRLINSYIRKHQLELDEFNYKSWLLNIYTYKAVITAIAQCFGEKNKNNNIEYFNQPIEEFYCKNTTLKEKDKQKEISKTHRQRVNYWAKYGRKGGHNGT